MIEAICPSCNEPVDAGRAPVARIREGQVVSFCSAACASTAGSGAVDSSAAGPNQAMGAVATQKTAAADGQGAAHPVRIAARRRRPIRLIAACVFVAGAAIAGIELTGTSGIGGDGPAAGMQPALHVSQDGESKEAGARDLSEPDAASTDSVDHDKLAAAAVGELRSLMNNESPRIAREAARALSRRNDLAALGLLAQRVADEPSPHAQVTIAHTLARAGDRRGAHVLTRLLTHKRRHVRMDAATALAELGDDSGRKELRKMLKVRTHRIGAARALALLGDEAGTELLRDVAAKSKSAEDRLRAAVYLGSLGHSDVRKVLCEILDRGDRIGAANALAVLGERVAVPALVEQLNIASVRVEAAVSLRRLEVVVDFVPLVVALKNSDPIGRVSAAEAVLILTGAEPPAELR